MAAARDALLNAGLLDGEDLSAMGLCLGSGPSIRKSEPFEAKRELHE